MYRWHLENPEWGDADAGRLPGEDPDNLDNPEAIAAREEAMEALNRQAWRAADSIPPRKTP